MFIVEILFKKIIIQLSKVDQIVAISNYVKNETVQNTI